MRKKQKREDKRGKVNTKCAKILTSGVCVKTRQGENIVVRGKWFPDRFSNYCNTNSPDKFANNSKAI
jgi:hypothetical protein